MNLPDMTKTIDDIMSGKLTADDALKMWGCRRPRPRRVSVAPKPNRVNLIEKIRENFARSGGTVTHADHNSIQIVFQSEESAARAAADLEPLKTDARRFGATVEIDRDDREVLILVTQRN